VKPNVGHSEGASGLTSLIKSVLSLENRTILPNIKFNNPNPKIPWEEARLTVPTDPMPFPKDRRERISINSFGLGGANVHAIIESAAEYHSKITGEISPVVNGTPTLLVFSANHPTSFEKTLEQYHALVAEGSVSLRNLSYTLGARRDHMTHKAFAIADGKSFDASPATKSSSSPPPAIVFTGQGAQWPTMGKELMEDYESFRADMQKMDDSLAQLKHAPSWKISDELLKSDGLSNIHKAEMSQPLCTAVQVALVNLLQSWGISPSAVVGHSSGEIAAAYAAGAFNMDTAIRIAFYRGFVANVINRKGSMAAIGLGRNVVEPYLTSGVVLACENSGGSVTISGDEDVVQNTIAKILIDSPDALARRLKVEIGYHSHHMADVGELYENLIQKEFAGANHELTIPFYSSVTGNTYLHSEGLGASYWRENLESPVLFYGAAESLLAASDVPNAYKLIRENATSSNTQRYECRVCADARPALGMMIAGMTGTVGLRCPVSLTAR
jgi:acyl transferase domain-containing protein